MATAPSETLPGHSFPTGEELTQLSTVATPPDEELISQLPADLAQALRTAATNGQKSYTGTFLTGITISQVKALRNTQNIQVTVAGPNTYTFSWQ